MGLRCEGNNAEYKIIMIGCVQIRIITVEEDGYGPWYAEAFAARVEDCYRIYEDHESV